MHVDLDTVPLRAENMTAAEILSSESQERMCAVVTPENVDAFMAVCRRWDVTATVIGEVTDGDRLRITHRGETVVDVPPRTVAHDGPVYERPYARPDWQDALQADDVGGRARPSAPAELAAQVRELVASPALAARTWVTEQYDRYVRGNTDLRDARGRRRGPRRRASGRGVAVSIDANARFCQLDPRAGAQLALAESMRNVASSGAVPVAVTDCLNFGSPEDPAVMWQFAEAVARARRRLRGAGPARHRRERQLLQPDRERGDPADAGGRRARHPHRRHAGGRHGLGPEGHAVWLLGETRDELDGSAWAGVVHDHLGGRPPAVDLAAESRLAALMASAGADGLLSGAHDLSDGGLAQALVEASLATGRGARVALPRRRAWTPPRSCSPRPAARMLVTVAPGDEAELARRCADAGQAAARLGEVGGEVLEIEGVDPLPLAELRALSEATLPAALD